MRGSTLEEAGQHQWQLPTEESRGPEWARLARWPMAPSVIIHAATVYPALAHRARVLGAQRRLSKPLHGELGFHQPQPGA